MVDIAQQMAHWRDGSREEWQVATELLQKGRVAARTDSRIEPIPCGVRQWVEDQSSAIIEIARREGQVILPDAA